VLGADHRDTLGSRNNLAVAYRAAGDLGRAIPLCEQVLADAVRVLGADHPHTLAIRNNLALAYQDAGDLGRAIPLFEQTLADRQRVLGADHPQTKTVRANLAAARQHLSSARPAFVPPRNAADIPKGQKHAANELGLISRACPTCCKSNDSRHDPKRARTGRRATWRAS
jgi:tetratricopeptide (TPR) repeat protein